MSSPPSPHAVTDEPTDVPPGRFVELPGRGRTFVRELEGPAGAPTAVLIHAWFATGGLNWVGTFPRLGEHFHVVAPDLRGHGRGLRTNGRFSLADCADDVGALMDELDVRSAVVVGYSMGGPIAQLLWRSRPDLVDGLVFCATSYQFVHGSQTRVMVTTAVPALVQGLRLSEVATHLPTRLGSLVPSPMANQSDSMARWAAQEVRRQDLRSVVEAGVAIGTYDASAWIGEIDVPTAVVLTTRDRAVPPAWQLRLARATDAEVFPLADGHVACSHALFSSVVTEASIDVLDRVGVHGPGRVGGDR